MKTSSESSRRGFIKKIATSTAVAAIGSNVLASTTENHVNLITIPNRQTISANDHINIALIGAGGMGTGDTMTALKVPGVKLVAVCDLYDGRLADAKRPRPSMDCPKACLLLRRC